MQHGNALRLFHLTTPLDARRAGPVPRNDQQGGQSQACPHDVGGQSAKRAPLPTVCADSDRTPKNPRGQLKLMLDGNIE